jgi:hypothetical protein
MKRTYHLEESNLEEDAELDMEVDSSTDMVVRLFRLSLTAGILCAPAIPQKVNHPTLHIQWFQIRVGSFVSEYQIFFPSNLLNQSHILRSRVTTRALL